LSTASKPCFKCGEVKPLSEFYRHAYMADGHLNKCKVCTKRDVWMHRRDNVERIREYDRGRGALQHRVAQRVSNTREYRERYPERYRANMKVARALRTGRLEKLPCWTCGESDVEAHHPDYSRPLSVVWLCAVHHKEIHLAYPDDHYYRLPVGRGMEDRA
jgi:hypothetical protein